MFSIAKNMKSACYLQDFLKTRAFLIQQTRNLLNPEKFPSPLQRNLLNPRENPLKLEKFTCCLQFDGFNDLIQHYSYTTKRDLIQ